MMHLRLPRVARLPQLVAATVILAIMCPTASAVTRVYLIGGQSNAEGTGLCAKLKPPFSDPQKDVRYWNDGWVSLKPGFGHNFNYGDVDPKQFGPEVSFGRAMADALKGDDIYLIKHGVNGANLAVQYAAPGSKGYIDFRKKVKAALANLDDAKIDYEISGMLWMQGQGDSKIAKYAAAYEANLTKLIATVRKDFKTPKMPFVIGRIMLGSDTRPPGGNAIVRAAQKAIADKDDNVYWFDTDSLQLAYPYHYGTQGQIDLGKLFAEKCLKAILKDVRKRRHR